MMSQKLTELEMEKIISNHLETIRPLIPPNVQLVAVTKTFPSNIVRIMYSLGIRNFGESKIQEFLTKKSALRDLTGITWHFIGHLQSNKAKIAVEHFDWIHSVDSLKLANRMNTHATKLNKTPKCCLQVKLVVDQTKDGFDLDELKIALPYIDKLDCLNVCGLMIIPPYGLNQTQAKDIFHQAQKLKIEIQKGSWKNIKMDELSMGMSKDFQLAIDSGSTIVRIGSGLFGKREYPGLFHSKEPLESI